MQFQPATSNLETIMAGYFNFKSSEANVKRWQATRESGRKAYIVKAGILGWGIPVALAVTGLDWYQGTPISELGVPLAIRLVLFGLVGGIAFGAVMWKVSEYFYAKAEQQRGQNQPAA
jgi:hypothetical protein